MSATKRRESRGKTYVHLYPIVRKGSNVLHTYVCSKLFQECAIGISLILCQAPWGDISGICFKFNVYITIQKSEINIKGEY